MNTNCTRAHSHGTVCVAKPVDHRPSYLGIKDDEALFAEIRLRLGHQPHTIESVLCAAGQVISEWRESGWELDSLDPVCGLFSQAFVSV